MNLLTKKICILFFTLHYTHTGDASNNQIVFTADGKKSQILDKKKIQKNITKNILGIPLLTETKKVLPPETLVKKTISEDIMLVPNREGKTFRLQIKTSLSPALAIIPKNDAYYIIMDKKYSIKLPELADKSNFIKSIDSIDNQDVTVLKISVDPFIYIRFEKNNDELFLTFFYKDAGSTYTHSPSPSLFTMKETAWPMYKISPISGIGKSIYVNIDGNNYHIQTSSNPDDGNQIIYCTPYFESTPTIQGIAIRNFSTKTHFSTKQGQLTANHNSTAILLPSPVSSKHFQNIFDVNSGRDITEEHHVLLAERNKGNTVFSIEKQFQLAWLNLALNFHQDAKNVLKNMAIQWPKCKHTPLYKALLGMAYFLNNEHEEALKIWKKIPNTLEISLWKYFSSNEFGRFDLSEQLIHKMYAIIKHYPKLLREIFIKLSLKTAENSHNIGAIFSLLEQKENFDSVAMKWIYNLYQAKIFHEKAQFVPSNSFLKEMHLEKNIDKASIEIIVENEFLKALNNKKSSILPQTNIIEDLNTLRLKWRGGRLEYRISMTLIKEYINEKYYTEALFQLTELKRLFPDRSQVELLDTEIQNIYIRYFSNIERISPLKIIKTYGDFIDFMPDGKVGERIIKIVAEQFERVDLLDEAAEILSRYQATQIDSHEKIDDVLRIIDIHIQNKKNQAALALIRTISLDLVSLEQKSRITTRHAQALLGEKKRQEALDVLEASTDPHHAIFASKIYAQLHEWQKAALRLVSASCFIDEKKDQALLISVINDLAVMYFMADQHDKLAELRQKYEKIMKDDKNFKLLTRQQNNKMNIRADAERVLSEISNIKEYIDNINNENKNKNK